MTLRNLDEFFRAALGENFAPFDYQRRLAQDAESSGEAPHSFFSRDILVLGRYEGANLGLESTAQLVTALRGAILKACSPVPEWISGHEESGAPLQRPHLAIVPLAYVGHPHADGHVLGLGCVFPRDVPPRERGRALQQLLFTASGEPRQVDLTPGRLGTWTLCREERVAPPLALQAETWTRPSRVWASVTPVALDRHPKTDRDRDRTGWNTTRMLFPRSRERGPIERECTESHELSQTIRVDW